MALDCFYSQTYENRELIVLDDYDVPSFPDGISHPLVRFHRTPNIIYSIPQKRNMANALAQGFYLWHLDSDDWSAPTRMAEQVERLERSGKAVTGFSSMMFHDERTGQVLEYRIKSAYVCGSSLCYLRSFWERNKFPESVQVGSDNRFVRAAREANQLDYTAGGDLMVARIHADNTNKGVRGENYHVVDISRIPAAFPRMVPVG